MMRKTALAFTLRILLGGSSYLNDQKLVRLLVDHALERARDLEQYGADFEKEGELYKLFPYTGSSIPRGVLATKPYHGGYILGLVEEVKRRDIEVLTNVMTVDLIKEKNEVVTDETSHLTG